MLLKKLLLSFLAALVVLFSVVPYFSSAKAASTTPTWYNQDFKTWLQKVDDQSNPSEIFGERYTSAQVEWVIYGLFAFLIHHTTPSEATSGCTNGDVAACATGIKNFFDSLNSKSGASLINTNQNLASLIFADRPLSGISYIRHAINNFRLVPVAYAQQTGGFGFAALTAVQKLWAAFRDISYGLFVIVAIVFAFMIMFRVKINPQTVITVQSAIPKIVLALIAVTFSYAIAGLMIDLLYVVIGLISLVMAPLVPTNIFNWFPKDAPTLFNYLTVGPTIFGHGMGIIGLVIMYLTPLILLLILFAIGGAFFSGGIVSIIAIFLLMVVIIIAIVMSIKTIWALFKALANIILLTIFAPLYLSLGVLIPNFGIGQWLKTYLSHLSAFLVTGVLWLLAWIFMLEAYSNISSGVNLTGPTATSPWPPLLGFGGGVFLVYLGVSFVLFTMIPKATELVQAALSGKPFAYGTSIGELTGPVGGAYAQYAGAQLAGGVLPAPFNREELNRIYRRIFSSEESRRAFGRRIEESTRTR